MNWLMGGDHHPMMIVIQDLRVFFTSLTRKTKGNQEISAENEKNSENQISCAFECLLKVQNQKFISLNGIEEHLIISIASRLGGKGRQKDIYR